MDFFLILNLKISETLSYIQGIFVANFSACEFSKKEGVVIDLLLCHCSLHLCAFKLSFVTKLEVFYFYLFF